MENRKFAIINISSTRVLIISSTWERPDVFWNELRQELQKISVEEVYFDFLLKNGLRDRFYKAVFDNGVLLPDSFESTSLDENWIRLCDHFFAQNWKLVENSVLSEFQKFRFRKQLERLALLK